MSKQTNTTTTTTTTTTTIAKNLRATGVQARSVKGRVLWTDGPKASNVLSEHGSQHGERKLSEKKITRAMHMLERAGWHKVIWNEASDFTMESFPDGIARLLERCGVDWPCVRKVTSQPLRYNAELILQNLNLRP